MKTSATMGKIKPPLTPVGEPREKSQGKLKLVGHMKTKSTLFNSQKSLVSSKINKVEVQENFSQIDQSQTTLLSAKKEKYNELINKLEEVKQQQQTSSRRLSHTRSSKIAKTPVKSSIHSVQRNFYLDVVAFFNRFSCSFKKSDGHQNNFF